MSVHNLPEDYDVLTTDGQENLLYCLQFLSLYRSERSCLTFYTPALSSFKNRLHKAANNGECQED